MISRESGPLEGIAGPAPVARRRAEEAGKTVWRNGLGALLPILGAAVVCTVAVGVSVALIDRPVATWVHEHLGYQWYAWFPVNFHGHLLGLDPFSIMAAPSEALRPLSALVFVVLAIAASAGWRPRFRGRIALALCLSVFASLVISSIAKEAFGRTWPESWLGSNPSWIRDGVYGFFPFHGGDGWGSFPSGHTSVVTAPATILWLVWPELRTRGCCDCCGRGCGFDRRELPLCVRYHRRSLPRPRHRGRDRRTDIVPERPCPCAFQPSAAKGSIDKEAVLRHVLERP